MRAGIAYLGLNLHAGPHNNQTYISMLECVVANRNGHFFVVRTMWKVILS